MRSLSEIVKLVTMEMVKRNRSDLVKRLPRWFHGRWVDPPDKSGTETYPLTGSTARSIVIGVLAEEVATMHLQVHAPSPQSVFVLKPNNSFDYAEPSGVVVAHGRSLEDALATAFLQEGKSDQEADLRRERPT